MAVPMAPNINYDGHVLSAWNLDPEEWWYRRFNASLFSATNNLTLNDSYNYDDYEEMENCDAFGNIITMILYAIVCIVGLFGNTLVIYVVLRFSKMQTVTNIYILNLAIADECFLIGLPFLIYTMQIGSWKFGEYMCKAYMVSTSVTQFTSSIFLLIMSADRYIAVCHPISSPRFRTPLISKIVSGIAWLTSVLLMLPVILFASTVYQGEHISCNIKWPEAEDSQSGTTFILYSLTLGFATPLTFILVFYCLVIRKLHTVGPKHKSKEKKRSHRKVTKLVLTVITVYIMCWLPYWISQVSLIHSSPSQCASRLEITVFLLVGCLSYSNSAMNPILYAFLSDNFKKSFMKACTCAARKDINAQLQLENSLFPKLGKNRQSERLLSGAKGRHKKTPNSATTTTTNTINANTNTNTNTNTNSNINNNAKNTKVSQSTVTSNAATTIGATATNSRTAPSKPTTSSSCSHSGSDFQKVTPTLGWLPPATIPATTTTATTTSLNAASLSVNDFQLQSGMLHDDKNEPMVSQAMLSNRNLEIQLPIMSPRSMNHDLDVDQSRSHSPPPTISDTSDTNKGTATNGVEEPGQQTGFKRAPVLHTDL